MNEQELKLVIQDCRGLISAALTLMDSVIGVERKSPQSEEPHPGLQETVDQAAD